MLEQRVNPCELPMLMLIPSRLSMPIASAVAGVAVLLAAGCAAGVPDASETASVEDVASCVQPFDENLAEMVSRGPGPYRVRIDFAEPPPRDVYLWWGLAECAGTTCSGLVEREKLARLCRDANVRDLEAWR